MRVRRVAGLVAAGVLALGAGAGVAGAAPAPAGGAVRASVQIPTGVFVELWQPYVTPGRPHCLEIVTSGVLYAQVYNCHASDGRGDNQLWQFIDLGGGSYWLLNKYWNRCVVAYSVTTTGLGDCSADATTRWHVTQSAYDPNGFELSNDGFGQCIAPDGLPPTQGGRMTRLTGCYNPPFFNGDVQVQTWRVG